VWSLVCQPFVAIGVSDTIACCATVYFFVSSLVYLFSCIYCLPVVMVNSLKVEFMLRFQLIFMCVFIFLTLLRYVPYFILD